MAQELEKGEAMNSAKTVSLLAIALLIGSGTAAAQTATDISTGHRVFDQWCSMCHAAGATFAGTVALETKYHGAKPAALEDRSDLTPALISYIVRRGVGLMPPIRKTEINDDELRDLEAYLAPSEDKKRQPRKQPVSQ
jgi:(+)-pinoresinol hydroxylase